MEPHSIGELVRKFRISERTIRNGLVILNVFLSKESLGQISLAAKGVAILPEGFSKAEGLLHVGSKRRYGKVDSTSCFYYSQMVQYDQKWSLWIGLSFFAVFAVGRWLFPSPNLNMTAIDIATSFYLGYIWTTKYKGEERAPFQYMETVFLLLTLVSNYIVFFAHRSRCACGQVHARGHQKLLCQSRLTGRIIRSWGGGEKCPDSHVYRKAVPSCSITIRRLFARTCSRVTWPPTPTMS
jgi:hypothetical protein